jgi:hypothetical protein
MMIGGAWGGWQQDVKLTATGVGSTAHLICHSLIISVATHGERGGISFMSSVLYRPIQLHKCVY